jgi:hypothetical protein
MKTNMEVGRLESLGGLVVKFNYVDSTANWQAMLDTPSLAASRIEEFTNEASSLIEKLPSFDEVKDNVLTSSALVTGKDSHVCSVYVTCADDKYLNGDIDHVITDSVLRFEAMVLRNTDGLRQLMEKSK